jgi:hypothetical protein
MPTRRDDLGHRPVKTASTPQVAASRTCRVTPDGVIRGAPFRSGRNSREHPEPYEKGATDMADLAYAVLIIGVFLLLALMLRGLEKL